MRTYLTALMLAVTLGLVSCGGGNDGASTGTPVVAQMTISTATVACVGTLVSECPSVTSESACPNSYSNNAGNQCWWYAGSCLNDGSAPCGTGSTPVTPCKGKGCPSNCSASAIGECLLRSFPACTQNMFGFPSSTAMWYAVEEGTTSTTCVWENSLYCNSDTCPATSCGGDCVASSLIIKSKAGSSLIVKK